MQGSQGIEGVYVANVTPFREDASLSVDVDSYLAHVGWLAEMGVRGVVPFGTNGEGPSVGLREKLSVLEELFGRDFPLQVIPTVMQGNLPETLEMVWALEDYPAAAVLVLPPYFFKPASVEGLRRFFEPVIEATEHRVILYHVPKYAVPVPGELAGACRCGASRTRGARPATRGPCCGPAKACCWGPRTTCGRSSSSGRGAS